MRVVEAEAIVTIVIGADRELYLEDALLTILGQGTKIGVEIVLKGQVLTFWTEAALDYLL